MIPVQVDMQSNPDSGAEQRKVKVPMSPSLLAFRLRSLATVDMFVIWNRTMRPRAGHPYKGEPLLWMSNCVPEEMGRLISTSYGRCCQTLSLFGDVRVSPQRIQLVIKTGIDTRKEGQDAPGHAAHS